MKESERGSVTLETSIVLPLFIILFLFVYGLFSLISAQNQTTHALIQSTKSLSLDSYLSENVVSVREDGTKFWSELSDMVLDIVRLDSDPNFSSQNGWYKSKDGNPSIAKSRFIGYIAGGDKSEADKKLKNLGIVGGLDGIKFTTIVEVEEETFSVTIEYEIQYWFDFFDMGKIPMKQTIKSRLWM